MAQIDWNSLMNGSSQPKKRYSGANVKFFNAYNENKQKSLDAGRAVFDEIPSISIQWPGGDETVRRIEPQDVQDYPQEYAAFTAGNAPIENGTPLAEWPPMNGSAMRELQYMGFKTVEQLAETNDDVKRRMGPLSQFVQKAKDWLDAANSSQFEVTSLRQQLEREKKRTAKLEQQMELLMQRIEGNEGIDLRPRRKEVIQSLEAEELLEEGSQDDVGDVEPVKRRGRPRKV
jgi:hypothetical protein